MKFRFGKKLDGFAAFIAAIVIWFVMEGWVELPKPFNYVGYVSVILSYLILFLIWLGSNYIWPPEEKKKEE
ncbi:MAG: hypothetical protein FJ044_04370 [Candidatus Cloacimonetes bacterium]|nr:hypothetical protein [Candidatus Cloacimonadota bacterium]